MRRTIHSNTSLGTTKPSCSSSRKHFHRHLVGSDRKMVFAQALEGGSNRVLGHGSCLLQRVALGDQSRESWTSHNQPAFLGGLEQHSIAVLDHCESPSS